MRIAGLQKLSLLDYPGCTACTVFTPGCNMRCPFCHNASLVLKPGEKALIDEDEFFAFLNKRRGLLDGVCISGGEPLLQLGLADFIRRVKDLGFKVKLDTNGSFPAELRGLVLAGLIDYVAMDVKNSFARYPETVGLPGFDVQPIRESIEFLLQGRVPYEFRTTVLKNFHTESELLELAALLQGAPLYALQGYQDSGDILRDKLNTAGAAAGDKLLAYSAPEMQALYEKVRSVHPHAVLRA